ncbi:MAG TPA: T9SS type A sorting domain-containing protein [Chitinophagales bacterium]|nr:T9SS type A sorting domain-containing protein [Chitinophagales bacterium]
MKNHYKFSLRITLFALALISAVVFNASATKHVVTVQNFSFSPSSLTINQGDTVQWKWVNGIHTTTSTTLPPGAVAWNNAIDVSNQTFNYVPAVVGTYNYKCNIHPTTMLASFTVVCPTASVSISAGGATTFCKGSSVTLSKNSAGTFSSFQWKLDGANIAGATTSSYNATASGSYTLVATNSCGNSATSNAIAVTVNKKPKADVTPAGPVNICAGQTVLLSVSTSNNQTYQWKNGNSNIPGATNPTFLVNAAGSYKCKVTKTNTGCTKTSKPVVVNVTCKGINAEMVATVFPNPASDYFLINTETLSLQDGTIRLFDLTGKLLESYVVQSETTEVGKTVPAGVYFLKIESAGKTVQVMKLMKN